MTTENKIQVWNLSKLDQPKFSSKLSKTAKSKVKHSRTHSTGYQYEENETNEDNIAIINSLFPDLISEKKNSPFQRIAFNAVQPENQKLNIQLNIWYLQSREQWMTGGVDNELILWSLSHESRAFLFLQSFKPHTDLVTSFIDVPDY